MKPINLTEALKTTNHQKKIEVERQAIYGTYNDFSKLKRGDVEILNRLASTKDFSQIPGFLEQHYDTYGPWRLWSDIVNAEGSTYSPVDAMTICINALLCYADERLAERVKGHFAPFLVHQTENTKLVLKNMAYFYHAYDVSVFSGTNMIRVNGDLVTQDFLKGMAEFGLAEPMIESAIRARDLEGVAYAVKTLIPTRDQMPTLRKCLRVKGVSKEFTKLALEGYENVQGFANDIITAVKSGSQASLERVYDKGLAERCHNELIVELMKDSYLQAGAIENVQRFVRMVIADGLDVYPAFLERYYGRFGAIDMKNRPRLAPHEILDRIDSIKQINSPASLDAFLPSVALEDVLSHPKGVEFIDRLHKMTQDKKYLKHTSYKHRGEQLSKDLGM